MHLYIYKWALINILIASVEEDLFILDHQVSLAASQDDVFIREYTKERIGSWRYLYWQDRLCRELLFAHSPGISEEALQLQYELANHG